MTRSIEEQLSALLDSELPVEEEALLLKRLQSGTEHRRTLGRYALIGDLIRGNTVNRGTLGLSESISAVVATEQAYAGRESGSGVSRPLAKGIVGAAIAASVAMVALLNLGIFEPEARPASIPIGPATVAGQPASFTTQPSYTVPPDSQRSNVIAPARLANYLVSHGEFSNSLSRQVMDSYIVNQLPQSDGTAGADSVRDEPTFE